MTGDAGPTRAPPASTRCAALVMVIMALDHVREFFHADAMVVPGRGPGADDADPVPDALDHPRLRARYSCSWPGWPPAGGCAAAARRADLSRYLLTRGLWLVLLEITVMRFALNFRFSRAGPGAAHHPGGARAVDGGARRARLPAASRRSRAFGVAVVARCTTCSTRCGRPTSGPGRRCGTCSTHPGVVHAWRGCRWSSGYPVLPWAGLMALGFAAGGVFDSTPAARRRILVRGGLALVAAFVVAARASTSTATRARGPRRRSPVMTVLSFLRTTKYPPSLSSC